MSDLTPADIRVAADYEAARDSERRHLADVKSHRRVVIDDTVAVVFENRETVRGVVQEVVRTEHLRDTEQIAAEVIAFNALLPRPGELSACLYIEVTDAGDLAERARVLVGIERAIFLEVGGERISAETEIVAVESGAPAMYHLRFVLSDAQRSAWRSGAAVSVGCDHPECAARVELREDQRVALAEDFA